VNFSAPEQITTVFDYGASCINFAEVTSAVSDSIKRKETISTAFREKVTVVAAKFITNLNSAYYGELQRSLHNSGDYPTTLPDALESWKLRATDENMRKSSMVHQSSTLKTRRRGTVRYSKKQRMKRQKHHSQENASTAERLSTRQPIADQRRSQRESRLLESRKQTSMWNLILKHKTKSISRCSPA
jgi:hypothetical protein